MTSLRRILHILVAASWAVTAVLGQRNNLYSGWTLKFDNSPYPTETARVGDSITFIWTVDEIQNVFIHPTNDCTQTGRIAIGNKSPTEYVFQESDAGKSLFFACDIEDRCENYGMRLVVNVLAAGMDDDGLEIPGFDDTPEPSFPPVFFFDTENPTAAPTSSPTGIFTFTSPPTASPTAAPVAPTDAPVAPTEAPVAPTEAPVAPTDAPIAPTDAPIAPTEAPVAPTEAPVAPTDAPVAPTDAPVAPTDAPVTPTLNPTLNPTLSPTDSPTSKPTVTPTDTPTTPPVPYPTYPPTPFPTLRPTAAPTEDPTTLNPTATPTKDDGGVSLTMAPTTKAPTSDATDEWTMETIENLQMTLSGIGNFPDSAKKAWESETAAFAKSFYERKYKDGLFRVAFEVTSFVGSTVDRKLVRGGEKQQRELQTSNVVVTYRQGASYNLGGTKLSAEDLAKSPFATATRRDNYVKALQSTNDPLLEAVTDASPVSFEDEKPPPTEAPVTDPETSPDKKPGLSLAAIIGIACGGAALLIGLILACLYCKGNNSKNDSQSVDPPPNKISIKEDEVSTLAGPSILGNAAYGDRSVGTVDYDYSKAYGNGEHSVSSAGGTFGSNTQNMSFPMNAGATGAALGPYGDDGSYEDHFRQSGAAKVKEEILHVFAPPGKLGVVIDTPDDGAPVVHAVKDTSVVVDKVKVGDKLVAVDDEDVRTLTAIKVSKLISRKSANPSRKLTILRTTHIG